MKKKKRKHSGVRLSLGRTTPYVPPVDMEAPDLYKAQAVITYRIPAARLQEVLGLPKEWGLIDGAAYDDDTPRRDIFDEMRPADGIECTFRTAVPGPARAMEILAGGKPKNV